MTSQYWYMSLLHRSVHLHCGMGEMEERRKEAVDPKTSRAPFGIGIYGPMPRAEEYLPVMRTGMECQCVLGKKKC